MAVGRSVLTKPPHSASGQRDKRVLIEQATEGADASGFPVSEWTPLRYAQMGRIDVRADEHHTASQESAFVETHWYTVYAADMDPDVIDVTKTRRLNYSGRIYDIRAGVVVGHK